ncbi:hypothetical protein ACJX0J_030511, partial [Zea mays]
LVIITRMHALHTSVSDHQNSESEFEIEIYHIYTPPLNTWLDLDLYWSFLSISEQAQPLGMRILCNFYMLEKYTTIFFLIKVLILS